MCTKKRERARERENTRASDSESSERARERAREKKRRYIHEEEDTCHTYMRRRIHVIHT